VVARQTLLAVEVVAVLPAVLATLVVAGEEDSVGHVASQAPGYLDELDEPDDQRIRILVLLRTESALKVGLHDLGLFGDDEHDSPLYRHQSHRLVTGVKG
jgi:hypothetical protein